MAYCDYGFYKSEYKGNVITEDDFSRLEIRAEDKLNALTFGRTENLPDDYMFAVRVKKALCALAEKMADVELANNTLRNSGGVGVSSVSSGSESISFRADTIISDSEQNKLYLNVVRDYLLNTGLLYAGL